MTDETLDRAAALAIRLRWTIAKAKGRPLDERPTHLLTVRHLLRAIRELLRL